MSMTCSLGNGPSTSLSLVSDSFHSFLPTTISCKHIAACSIPPAGYSALRMKVPRVCEGGNGGGDDGGGGFGGSGGGGGPGDGAYGKAGGIGLFATLWARYMELLDSHPLVIKSLTAGALNMFADLICQVFLEKVQQIDIQRLLSFTSIGMFMSGPGLHYWYGMLPKVITVPGFAGVLLRIAADQLFFTPVGMGFFFSVLCILEGRQHEIKAKLTKDWFPTIVANWKVWIPFQMLNFGFIPPQLQVAATSLMGVAWSIFISFIGHN